MGASCAAGEFARVNRKCSHILQNGEHTFGGHFGFSSTRTTCVYFCQSSKTGVLLVVIFVLIGAHQAKMCRSEDRKHGGDKFCATLLDYSLSLITIAIIIMTILILAILLMTIMMLPPQPQRAGPLRPGALLQSLQHPAQLLQAGQSLAVFVFIIIIIISYRSHVFRNRTRSVFDISRPAYT